MPGLQARFESSGSEVNVVEGAQGGSASPKVDVVFTDPPDSATDVVIEVIDVKGEGDPKKQGPLAIARFTRAIQAKVFQATAATSLVKAAKDANRAPRVTFLSGGKQIPVTFPDDREENGRFDLIIQTKGKLGGKPVTWEGSSQLHVLFERDVMAIPATSIPGDPSYGMVREWAAQWRNHAVATRTLVTVIVDSKPIGTPVTDADYAHLVAAYKKAISQARGGKILHAIGHGDGGQAGGVAWFHLVPENHAPVTNPDGSTTYPQRLAIDRNELLEGDPEVPSPVVPSSSTQAKLRALDAIGDATIDKQLSKKPPAEIWIHTCNVGNDSLMLQKFANRVYPDASDPAKGVRGHKEFIVYSGKKPGTFISYYENDEPTDPKDIETARHEPPSKLLTKTRFRRKKAPKRFPAGAP